MLQIEKDINGFDKKGVELIYNKFNDSLKSNGLEEAKVELGYKLGEKTIRYPKVVVGQ